MHVQDLSAVYRSDYLHAGNRDRYEQRCPDLFTHYYTFWADRTTAPVRLSETELDHNRALVIGAVSSLGPVFEQHGFPLGEFELILMVGQRTSNGHAFRRGDRFAAWVALESYHTQLLAEIFVAHEIIHQLHYQLQPGFFFSTRAEQQDPIRLLMTEGVASYLTARLLGCDAGAALWADYLNPAELTAWMTNCQQNTSRLARCFEKCLAAGDPHDLFVLADPADIYRNRGGYYLGLQVVAAVSDNLHLAPADLLNMSHNRLAGLIRHELARLADGCPE